MWLYAPERGGRPLIGVRKHAALWGINTPALRLAPGCGLTEPGPPIAVPCRFASRLQDWPRG
jgi:hypothetical protein